jgi:restriction system protein
MPIPLQRSIEPYLLHEIEMRGGSVRARDPAVYDALAQHFSRLTDDDQKLTDVSDGANRWRKRVDFTRLALVHKGELDGSQRGIWRITDKGRGRLQKEWPPVEGPQYGRVSAARVGGGTESVAPPPPVVPEPGAGRPEGDQESLIGKGREQLSDRVRGLSPAAFERLCARLLAESGYTGVTVTGRSGDGGIDGRAKLELGIEPLNMSFQAKRWTTDRKVGADHVRTFAGGLGGEDALGIYITTSRFTDEAVEAAKRSMKPIVLIDGQRILDLMTNAGLGVKSRPVVEQVIDEQFFRNLES